MTTSHQLLGIVCLAAIVAGLATLFGVLAVPAEHHASGEVAQHSIEHGAAGSHHAVGEHDAAGVEDENGLGAGDVTGALLISLAAIGLVPLARRSVGQDGGEVERTAPRPQRDASEPLRLAVALASAGAATIHFAVAAQHFEEYWLFGLFFVGAAVLQLAWALLVLFHSSRAVYLAGAAGNAAVVAMWVVSRTTGLPLGPDPGEAEPVGLADTVATLFEVLIAAGALLLASAAVSRPPLPRLSAGAALATLAVTAATALSLLALAGL